MLILRCISPKIAFYGTHFIAHVFPETEWYMATLRITRLLTVIAEPFAGRAPLRAEWMLHIWLRCISRPFPIPTRTAGTEALIEARTNPNGMALVSLHVPFFDLILRPLFELGCPPDAVISSVSQILDGKFRVGGMAESSPALAAQDPNVLLKARRILQRGGMVAALIDANNRLNPNILRLVGSVGARLLFYVSEMQENGEILFRFLPPPDPFCRTPEGILSNIEYLRAKVLGISQSSSQPDAAEHSLDAHAERRLQPLARSSSQEVQ
jgi:hypothetical protein